MGVLSYSSMVKGTINNIWHIYGHVPSLTVFIFPYGVFNISQISVPVQLIYIVVPLSGFKVVKIFLFHTVWQFDVYSVLL